MEEIISASLVRREWFDSFQLVEFLEQRAARAVTIPPPEHIDLSALAFAGPSSAEFVSPAEEAGLSSPAGGNVPVPGRSFWFNVNAELIVYGATEPSARVTIGGRPIRLRPDGTFSYRFALPDGLYELPIVARSADDARQANLRFTRHTAYSGEVGAHPQDAQLRTPGPENVA